MRRIKNQDRTIQLALEAFKSTGYLIVNKTLIEKFGLVKASVLSNYIDKYQYFLNKYDWFRGEFFLKHLDIMEQLNLKESTIRSAKKEFINLGILSTRMKGAPAKEWIQINFQTLISLGLDPQKTTGLDPQKTTGLIRRTNNKENKSNKDSDSRTKEFFPLAEYLYNIILANSKMRYGRHVLKAWATDIRKLSEINGVPYLRIKKALRWYKNNIGKKYIPIILSGESLRNKFIKLEAAISRQNGSDTYVNKEEVEREDESWKSKFGKK